MLPVIFLPGQSAQTPPAQPGQPVTAPGPCRDREWMQDQATESGLRLQSLGRGACLGSRSSRLSPQLAGPEAPALFWLLGPPVLLPPLPVLFPERNITEHKKQGTNRSFLPGSHTRMQPLTPPPTSTTTSMEQLLFS